MRINFKNKFFIFFCLAFLFFVWGISYVFAQTDIAQGIAPQLQVSIGDLEVKLDPVTCSPGQECEIGWIGTYIAAIYRWGVGVAAALAVLMIMVGGFLWLTSGGSPDRVSRGKDFITSSLLGLLLALFSFTILYTINPRLVALEPITVLVPEEVSHVDTESITVQCCVCKTSGSIGKQPSDTCYDKISLEDCRGFNSLVVIPESGSRQETTCTLFVGASCYQRDECKDQIAAASGEEQAVRNQLEVFGIKTKPPCKPGQTIGCVSLEGLPASAVRGLIQLNQVAGPIFISGGTEPGHSSHGIGKAVVDLRYYGYPNLENHITSNAVTVRTGPFGSDPEAILYTMSGGTLFVDETPRGGTRHWHVEF